MIKDVVIHNGLLRIATGTFVCMVHSENASERIFLEIGPVKSRSCQTTPLGFVKRITETCQWPPEVGSNSELIEYANHFRPSRNTIWCGVSEKRGRS